MSLFRRSNKANKSVTLTPEEQIQQTLVPLATLVGFLMERGVIILQADASLNNMVAQVGAQDANVQAAAFALHGQRQEVQALGAFVRRLQELHIEEQSAA